jgi:hypothetical protein
MRQIPDQLKSRNLVPFKKRNGKYNLPGTASENEDVMARVDTDLSPEEQGFIRHYLGYADAFLRSVEYMAPEAQEEAIGQNEVAQNGREEVTEQPTQAKKKPDSQAA